MILAAVLLLLIVWWAVRVRRRNVLAGRNSAKPTYMIEPPARRVGSRSRESL